jgi:hypothetical protein
MAVSITVQKGMMHSRALCRQVRPFFTSNSRSEGGAIFGHFSNSAKTSAGNSGTAKIKQSMQGKESLDMWVDIPVTQTQSAVGPRFVTDDTASTVPRTHNNDLASLRLNAE